MGALVDAHGSAAAGFHAVSVGADDAVDQCRLELTSPPKAGGEGTSGEGHSDAVAAWAARVVQGTSVLVAFVNVDPSKTMQLLAVLAAAGLTLGLDTTEPPTDCSVLVPAG